MGKGWVKNKDQDIKTHNKGWTKYIRQQTKNEAQQKKKKIVTNYIINIKHQDST